MKLSYVTDYFLDAIPFKRKSSLDWIVPASIALGVGAAVGVGIGMLFAPATGDETRAKLRDGAYRLKERAMTAAEEAKRQIASKANGIAGEMESRSYDMSR